MLGRVALWDEVCEEVTIDPAVSRGVVFGNPGLKLGRKVFACEVDGDLVVKLGAERVSAMAGAGQAQAFDPMGGRPMKAWARVPEPDAGDSVRAWVALAEEAKALLAAGAAP